MILIDNFGDPQKVDVHLFYWMFGFTWGFHIIACVLTLCYYAAHPSSVPMNPGVKLDFWIFGKQIVHQNQVTIRTFQYHNQIILFQEAYELVSTSAWTFCFNRRKYLRHRIYLCVIVEVFIILELCSLLIWSPVWE